MYKIGLCSVTFRKLAIQEVIEAAKTAGIEGIEWGGDVHVPPGEFARAEEVAKLTAEANLDVVSYGSYYRVGEQQDISFELILETAKRLQAPAIRVWAGKLGSKDADANHRQLVVEDARRIAKLAAEVNVVVHFEYHGGTLTDTDESAENLMQEIDHPNIHLYWQPAVDRTVDERLESIERLRPWLSNVHVFHWQGRIRLPFVEGEAAWKQYLTKLNKEDGTCYLLMEFVKDESVEQFVNDVQVLRGLV